MPKVFFIGDFKKPYSTEVYIVHGLKENGVEVIEWQEDTPVALHNLINYVVDSKPDFVLVAKNRLYTNGKLFIDKMREKGIKTVSWLFDLYHDLPQEMGSTRSMKDSPFSCDYIFTSDGSLKRILPNKDIITLRQGIHEPEATIFENNFKFDVCFIGSDTYFLRRKLINELKETYKERFCHFGVGGMKNEVRGLDLNNILSTCKVVVGDSVPYDEYWSNRIYEILGRGGFLLHPKVKGLKEEFEYYKHFVPFDYGNFEQIKQITDYYITHDEEREKIKLAGHKFCKENYTYTKRCQTLLQKVIGKNEPDSIRTVYMLF